MSTRFMTIMLMGISGLAFTTTNASASDLSRLIERSRFSVAYQSGGGYPNYYSGYDSPYAPQYYSQPQYIPQFQPQWGGYGASVPTGFGYGYGVPAPVPQFAGYGLYDGYGGNFGHRNHDYHHHGGGWGRGSGWDRDDD